MPFYILLYVHGHPVMRELNVFSSRIMGPQS